MSVLLRQARNGDQEAQNNLLARLQKYLAFVANHQLDKNLQAKMGPSDVVQQSMIQAVENLDKFQGSTVDEFRAWIRQILVNEARQLKRDFRPKTGCRARTQIRGQPDFKNQIDLADSLPTPGTNAAAKEQAQAIEAALAKLPKQDRDIIQWKNWDGLKFEEIADRLNISASNASRKWYRALLAFKKQLEEEDES